jgi:peroxiredoxin
MIIMMASQVYRYVKRVLVVVSIFVNVLLGGSVNQTFSARNWDRKRNGKFNIVVLIDGIFGRNHCCYCWVVWKFGV